MMKKIISFLLLFMAVMVFATWQYRLLCFLFFILLNRNWVKSLPLMKRTIHSYSFLIALLLVGIFISIPNYIQRGRTQLVYLNDNGQKTSTPLSLYVVNALFPEEEVMNICLKATAILPSSKVSPIFKNLGSRFIRDAQKDFWNGKAIGFYTPYNQLSWQGSNPGSFAITQAYNEFIGGNYNGIYITKPKHYSTSKNYPVVFFAHGYLGSWEFYQGFLSSLKDCFIVSMATRDLSGIFSYEDINKIFKHYLPLLKEEGYNIDESHLHLIGLSNGGTASNVALRSFDNRFQTITYISTSCDVIKRSHAKVLLIGGGKDASSSNLPGASKRLQRRGTKTAILFDDEENHYIMVHQKERIMEFLNKELELI